MFTIKELDKKEVVDFFINDPQLYLLGLPDEFIVALIGDGKFLNPYNSFLQGVYEKDELVMFLMWEPFTSTSISIHTYIPSKYHGTGKYKQIMNWLIKTYWQPDKKLYKIMAMPPSSCTHVIKAIKKIGFKLEGQLKNAVEWRSEVVDLMMFSYNFDRGNN